MQWFRFPHTLIIRDDITIPLLIIWEKIPWTFAEPSAKSKTDTRLGFDKRSDLKPFLACDNIKYSQLLLSKIAAKMIQKQYLKQCNCIHAHSRNCNRQQKKWKIYCVKAVNGNQSWMQLSAVCHIFSLGL